MRNPRVVRGGWLAGLPIPVARQVTALTTSRSGGSQRWRHGWWMRTRTAQGAVMEATLVHYAADGRTITETAVICNGELVAPFTTGPGVDNAGR